MAGDFVAWLIGRAEEGDQSILDRLKTEVDRHLAGRGRDAAAERQRVAVAFSEQAPLSALAKDMLAIIQAG